MDPLATPMPAGKGANDMNELQTQHCINRNWAADVKYL